MSFLQIVDTWLSKFNLLSIVRPKRITDFVYFISALFKVIFDSSYNRTYFVCLQQLLGTITFKDHFVITEPCNTY